MKRRVSHRFAFLALRVLGPLALAAGLLSMPQGASAQVSLVQLSDCGGAPEAQPLNVVLYCADAGVIAGDLTWTGWGSPTATASGVATVKTCEPDCATGGTEQYAVALTADSTETCRDGSVRYTRVRVDWPAGSPFPADTPAAADPYYPYPCPLPEPKFSSMRVTLTGHSPSPSGYYVTVAATTRFCAPKQRLTFEVEEAYDLFDEDNPIANHDRRFSFQHAGGCRTRRFHWRLRDEFFGIGVYRVIGNFADSLGQFSRSRTKKFETYD